MAQPQPQPTLTPGMVLEQKYRIVRHLADGGMGAVYEAEHMTLGRSVAVKVLHPEFARNPDFVARFRKEAQAASAIGHQHIIDIIDLGSTVEGGAFIVMELLRGQNLADRLLALGGRMPVSRAAHVIRQVLEAVAATHRRNIVHRDLKPENIYLVQRGTDPDVVKVLDFGISKALGEQGGARMATTGQILGTPYYMAPEQTRGAPSDHRVDIYACGALLYQLVTGALPFTAPNINALLFEIAGGRYVPAKVRVPALPAGIDEAIARAMALDPSQRFVTAEAFAQAVTPFAQPVMAPPITDERSLRPPPSARAAPPALSSTAVLAGVMPTRMPPLTLRRFAMIGLIGALMGLAAGWWVIGIMDKRAAAHGHSDATPAVTAPVTLRPKTASMTPRDAGAMGPDGGGVVAVATGTGTGTAPAPTVVDMAGQTPPPDGPSAVSLTTPAKPAAAKVILRISIDPPDAAGLKIIANGTPMKGRSLQVRPGARVELRARALGYGLWKQVIVVKRDQAVAIKLVPSQ